MKRTTSYLAVTLLLITAACSGVTGPELEDSEAAEHDVSTDQPTHPHEASSRVLLHQAEADQVDYDFEASLAEAPVVVESDKDIESLVFVVTSRQLELYYQLNGTGAWHKIEPEWSSDRYHNAYLEPPAGTKSVRVWSRYPIEYGFVDVHHEPVGGAFTWDDEPTEETTESDGESRTEQQMLSRSGRWIPPADVRAAGEEQYVPYESAPAWDGGRNCSGGLRPGARALGEFLVSQFEGARYFQGYACRRVRGGRSMSVHGTGRAIDVFVRTHGGRADNDQGDPVGNYLIEHGEELGVQFIIWDRTKWNPNYSGRNDRYYGGKHAHHDHLHIELTRAAAGAASSYPGEAPTYDGHFADDDGNTHEETIEAIYEAGITRGCSNGSVPKYCPNRRVSRANAAVMLRRAFGYRVQDVDHFDDDDGLAAESAINTLAEQGLLSGCDESGKSVCPDKSLTRGQLAVILSRGLQLPETSDDYFDDDDGAFYERAANRLAAGGLTSGCSERAFCGSEALERDQFASFIARAFGLISGYEATPKTYRGEFADDDGTTWEDAIDAIARAGITEGCQQGDEPAYCPTDSVRRAHAATMLVRALNLPASGTDWFTDDDGSVHEANINAIAAAGITSGCDDDKYCPDHGLTRGQAAIFFQRAFDLPDASTDYFDDDDGEYWESAANALRAAGITSGCTSDGRDFCGERTLIRGEIAVFFARALGL